MHRLLMWLPWYRRWWRGLSLRRLEESAPIRLESSFLRRAS
ncbi:MAG: hypothetical protein ACKV22_26130 [Bryobacteraceae bacterium]